MKQLNNKEQQVHLSRWVSSTEGRVSVSILKEDFYNVPSFNKDALEMARIAGRREVIQELIDLQED